MKSEFRFMVLRYKDHNYIIKCIQCSIKSLPVTTSELFRTYLCCTPVPHVVEQRDQSLHLVTSQSTRESRTFITIPA